MWTLHRAPVENLETIGENDKLLHRSGCRGPLKARCLSSLKIFTLSKFVRANPAKYAKRNATAFHIKKVSTEPPQFVAFSFWFLKLGIRILYKDPPLDF
jgi:hypothetical protein